MKGEPLHIQNHGFILFVKFVLPRRRTRRRMSKSDLTPEEQETIQTQKDPSVIVTASGEETTFFACDLYIFVQVQLLKELPAILSLGKLYEQNGYSYQWHPGQPSYPIKNGRTIECKTDNHSPLVVPGV